MHFSAPLDSAGFSRLDASSVPPEAAPAPISVWISSMNRIALGLSFSDRARPSGAARSRRGTWCPPAARPCRASTRWTRPGSRARRFCAMRQARPSAIAVLPTPASPTSSGLFLRRRHRIWITRSTSYSRPISGSILPSLAAWLRFCVNCSSGEAFSFFSPSPSSPSEPAALAALGGLGRIALLDAVGDEVHHVQARHALLVQVVHGVRVLLAEDRHQHVGAGDFLLAVAGGLHVHDRALDHALEAQRRLGVHLVGARHRGRVVLDEVGQRLAQVVDVGAAGAQHFGRAGIVQQGQQQVLHGDELVALLTRFHEGHVQADFQFLGNHAVSICLHCNFYWTSVPARWTGSLQTLVAGAHLLFVETPQTPHASWWIFSMICVAVSMSLVERTPASPSRRTPSGCSRRSASPPGTSAAVWSSGRFRSTTTEPRRRPAAGSRDRPGEGRVSDWP